MYICGLPQWLSSKESACNAGEPGFIPGLGRSPGTQTANGTTGTETQGVWLESLCFDLPLYMCQLIIIQFSSVAQLCPTLCDPIDCSTPGLPVHHQLLEFTQTYVHRVGDAIQPSHPLSSPSPPAPNPSQHQGLFQ